jgi:molybdopterin molybdotransferase
MISVTEAREIINRHTQPLPSIELTLAHAHGFILAETVAAPMSFPSFPQAAVDGYALRYEDYQQQKTFVVQDIIQAGDTRILQIAPGKAVRIFTGAPVPTGADIVIMQEHTTTLLSGDIQIDNPGLTLGANIRPIASQCKLGDVVLPVGHVLTPASLSLLAGLGMNDVTVIRKPRVTILNTGDELVSAGNALGYGKIYESNSVALLAALQSIGISTQSLPLVPDTLEDVQTHIQKGLSNTEILLITGGVSVGDYDFVRPALEQIGAEILFHKIKQKPGKPLLFAQHGDTLIFGLPGNPASVLTCFYVYVIPCIRQLMGVKEGTAVASRLPLLHAYSKKPGLTHFPKARKHPHGVEILDHQESYKMNSFALADAIVEIPEEGELLAAGDWVQVHNFLPL